LFEKNTKGNLIAWTFSHDAYKDVPQFKQLLVWFTYLNSIVDDSNKQSMKDLFPYINALEYVYTAKLPSSKPPILTDLCKTLECFPPTEPAPQGHWSTSVKN
jgi:hypothetical protein